MVSVLNRTAGVLGRLRSLVPLNWGVLLLFVLFSTGIGVREAKAEPELTIAACTAACAAAWTNLASTTFCAGCVILLGRKLSRVIWGGEDFEGGWDCAKADIGC